MDPEALEPASSGRLLERFARIEKLGAAGKALCARRFADSNAWWDTGERSPAHHVASVSGTTVGRACEVLFTAEALPGLPSVDAAFRKGELSEVQAIEITSAAALDPSSEQLLLEAAELEELKELRRECARVRAAARSESEREKYLHQHRRLNTWTDREGFFRMSGWLTPQSGAVVMASLEPFRQKVTLRSSHKETEANRLADALVAMAEHSRHLPDNAMRPGPATMIHVRVDYSALKRGSVEKGEICEVPGVGPIPLRAAEALMSDAFIAAFLTKGEDILSVAHLGGPSRHG